MSYEILNSTLESFYSGPIYVSLEGSVFHGSDPLRHMFELCAVLLALFLIKDFNLLNVGQCAPYQSYINPAERCMSLLNIGLQGLALEQKDAGVFEAEITSCKFMKALR